MKKMIVMIGLWIACAVLFSQLPKYSAVGGGGGAPTGAAGGKLSGTYPNPGLNASSSDLSDAASLLTTSSTATTLNAPLFCEDAGSTDTYACNLSPAIASYVTGTHYRFKANTANSGAASINFNSKGALTIKKVQGAITTDLADNDIRVGQWVEIVYDGTNAQMVSQLGNAGTAAYPSRALMFHGSSIFTVGGAGFVDGFNGSQMFGSVAGTSGTDGETFTQSFMLAAGTYTLSLLGATFTDSGKIDWYLDEVSIATGQDWYTGTLTYNVVETVASVSVVGNGRHVLKAVVNGKNGSSSDYIVRLTAMRFIPGSDTTLIP